MPWGCCSLRKRNCVDIFSRLSTVHERDRHTDRQTDKQRDRPRNGNIDRKSQ